MWFQERNGAEFPLWNGQLRTTRRQVQSPALHSGLKDLYCYSCNIGRNLGLDLIPDPEAPYAAEQPEKIKNKKTEEVLAPEGSQNGKDEGLLWFRGAGVCTTLML